MFHVLGDLILFARTVLPLESHECSFLVLPNLFNSPVSICRSVSITAQISGITLPSKVEIPLFQALLPQFQYETHCNLSLCFQCGGRMCALSRQPRKKLNSLEHTLALDHRLCKVSA